MRQEQDDGTCEWDDDVLREAAKVQAMCAEYVGGSAATDSAASEANGVGGSDGGGGRTHGFVLPPGVHMFGLRKVFARPGSLAGAFALLSHYLSGLRRLADGCLTTRRAAQEGEEAAATTTEGTRGDDGGELIAVECNWLSVSPGQCFCLLG